MGYTFQEEKKDDMEEEMVVVTGYKRSGTSLMMALVENLGVDLNYCPQFEADLREFHGGKNDFYYEDAKLTAKKVPTGGSVWFNGAIKMFSHVVTHNVRHAPPERSNNVKVIWMSRCPSKIERSIRRYKKPGKSYKGPGGHSSSTLEDELNIIGKLNDFHSEAVQAMGTNILTVEFDELLKNPVSVAKDVAKFLEKPYDDSMVNEFLKLVNPNKAAMSILPAVKC